MTYRSTGQSRSEEVGSRTIVETTHIAGRPRPANQSLTPEKRQSEQAEHDRAYESKRRNYGNGVQTVDGMHGMAPGRS